MIELNNKQISKIIEEIGEMLEIIGAGKDQFRIIAYQNAARKIEMMNEELGDIYQQDGLAGLDKISGIGKSIAKTIEEILKTGKCRFHDELAKYVPSPILKFMAIPGVGPHIARSLYNNYHAKTVSDLKQALKNDNSNRVFKEKTRENILEGIELLSMQTGRMLLSFAEPIAEEVITSIKKMNEINHVNAVGSLRRMKDTIGDIDIIASLKIKKENEKVINKFIKMPYVERIIESGSTKATIIHKNGPSIDLEILTSDEYGSLLQHFTGSKEHNVALRTWAEKHGYSISEHGIKVNQNLKLKTPASPSASQGGQSHNSKLKTIKCKTEKEVYRALGMDWIPPELRENNGEIEASLKHKLPHLVELKDIKGDLHLHSTWSEGELNINEIAKEAVKLGYEYIAITDHTVGLGITHGLKEKDIPKYIKAIEQCNNLTTKHGLKVLSGAEVNILANGKLDISDKELSKLDVVIASIHSGFRQDEDIITNRLISAIQNPNVDIIGHPSGRSMPARQPLKLNWAKVFTEAKKYNVVMEINCHPQRLDLNDELVRMAKEYGIKFVINTDMHHAEHFQNMRYGVAVARRGWLEKQNIINALNYKKFIESYGK